jgi:hypothetical protein
MPLAELYPIIAAVGAGLAWSTIGVWEKLRNREPNTKLDYERLGKNALLGLALGIGTYVYSLISGDSMPIIWNIETFMIAAGTYFPIVVVVDKLLIGKKASNQQ